MCGGRVTKTLDFPSLSKFPVKLLAHISVRKASGPNGVLNKESVDTGPVVVLLEPPF